MHFAAPPAAGRTWPRSPEPAVGNVKGSLSIGARSGELPAGGRSVVTYECTVDNSGEESGLVYVSRFRTVAQLQRSEIERAEASKQGNLFGFGLFGLGAGAVPGPGPRAARRAGWPSRSSCVPISAANRMLISRAGAT